MSAAQRLHVLIVTDNASLAARLEATMCRARFAPIWQHVADESAFRSAVTAPFDLICLDTTLSAWDFRSALPQVRALAPGTPCIVLGEGSDEAQVVWAIKHGADDYVNIARLERFGPVVAGVLAARKTTARTADFSPTGGLSDHFARATVDSLSAHIAILDRDSVIVAVNAAWREFASANGADPNTVSEGQNYLTVCDRAASYGLVSARDFATGLRAVIAGTLPEFNLVYECHSPGERRWFQVRITPFRDNGEAAHYYITTHENITARMEAVRALEQEHRLLRTLIDSIPDYIFVKDRQGYFRASNAAHARAAGKDIQSLIGKRAGDVFPPNLAAAFEDDDQTVLAGGLPIINAERQTMGPDGKPRWVLTTKVPLYGEDGRITGLIGISRDITRRRQAEQETLETSNQLARLNRLISLTSATLESNEVLRVVCQELASLLDVPQVAAVLIDEGGQTARVVAEYVNRLAGGVSAEGTIFPVEGNAIFDYLDRYRIPVVFADVQSDPRLAYARETLVQRGTVSMLVVPLMANGELIGSVGCDALEHREFGEEDILTAATIAQTASNALENSLLHRKVTSYNQRLEELIEIRTAQLERLNRRMAAILHSSHDPIVLLEEVSPDLVRIENTNAAFDRVFGYPPDALFRESVLKIIAPDYQTLFLDTLRGLVTGEPRSLEVQAVRSDGSTFDADVGLAAVAGPQRYVVGTIHDISRYKSIERIKDHFISTINHELRTPIAGIMLTAEVFSRYYDRMNEAQRVEKANQIQRQAEVITELIDSVLDMTRVESRVAAPSSMVDMVEVTEKIVSELRSIAEQRHQTLTLTMTLPTVIVKGDEVDFARIWRNLLSNAIKYTPDNGRIDVVLGKAILRPGEKVNLPHQIASSEALTQQIAGLAAGDYLVGQVRDNGHGMSPDDISTLFTRFQRGWAKYSNIPGSGLGLALVREILTTYGGSIHVGSEVGRGSTFTFWIRIGSEETEISQ